MNWYKKAVKEYIDVGHAKHGDDNFEYQLWVFRQGQMQISEMYNPESVRAGHYTEFGNISNDETSGRYNHTSGEISISPSWNFQEKQRDLPKPILSKIINAFPEATKAYIFFDGRKVETISL
jgi:hypothetical protein